MAILAKRRKKPVFDFPRISAVQIMVNRQRLVSRLAMFTPPLITLHYFKTFALPAGISKFF